MLPTRWRRARLDALSNRRDKRSVNEGYVPTLDVVWDFLVSFKEVTEAGFVRLGAQLEDVDRRLTARLDRVEVGLDRVQVGLDRVDLRLDGVEQRMDNVERRLVRIDDRLSVVEDTLRRGI